MNREDVYKALDSERDYQDAQTANPDRPDMVEIDMAGILLAMEHQLLLARQAWYIGFGNHATTMDCLRKVGGLTVKAGEQFGMEPRS